MLKAHVGNRDSISVVEFRLKCLEADQEGVIVDDEGVEYMVNRYGVTMDNMLHPAEKLDCDLVCMILELQKAKRKLEKKKAAEAA
jgi:hypothetical protein